MDTPRLNINEDNMVTFVCPECRFLKIQDVSEFKDSDTTVRIEFKCRCGKTYSAFLERREYYRKATNLPGMVTAIQNSPPITIVDLSLNGVRFKLNDNQKFNVGDAVYIEFQLDDPQQASVLRKVIIKKIEGNYISGQFDEHVQCRNITPYLYPVHK